MFMLMLLGLLLAQANGIHISTACWVVFTVECVVDVFSIYAKVTKDK